MVSTLVYTAVVDFAFDEEGTPEEAARLVAQTYAVSTKLTGRDTGNSWPELRISGPRAYVKSALIKSWGYDPREADDAISEQPAALLVCSQCGRGSYYVADPAGPVYACTNIQCDHEVTDADLELEDDEQLVVSNQLLCVLTETF